MSKHDQIFSRTDCLSQEVLLNYAEGKLTNELKHDVEKHLLDCELCSDAVEGLKLAGAQASRAAVTHINRQIDAKIARRSGIQIFLHTYSTQLAVAASVICILGLVWIFRDSGTLDELSQAESEKLFAEKFQPFEQEEKKEEAEITSSTEEQQEIDPRPAADRMMRRSQHVDMLKSVTSEKRAELLEGEDVMDEQPIEETVAVEERPADAVKSEPVNDVPAKAPQLTIKDEKNQLADRDVAAQMQTAAPSRAESVVLSNKESAKSGGKKRAKSKSMTQGVAQPASEPATQMDDVMGAGTAIPSTDKQDNAIKLYKDGNYSASEKIFEDELQKNRQDRKSRFYVALNLLSQEKVKEAVSEFEKLVKDENGEYYEDALWYISLAHIKLKEKRKAKKYLEKLINLPAGKYTEKAKETLKELE